VSFTTHAKSFGNCLKIKKKKKKKVCCFSKLFRKHTCDKNKLPGDMWTVVNRKLALTSFFGYARLEANLADPRRPSQTLANPRKPAQTLTNPHKPTKPSQTIADLPRPFFKGFTILVIFHYHTSTWKYVKITIDWNHRNSISQNIINSISIIWHVPQHIIA
jgi:hypothetical protein